MHTWVLIYHKILVVHCMKSTLGMTHFYFEFVTIIELQWIDSQFIVRRIHF